MFNRAINIQLRLTLQNLQFLFIVFSHELAKLYVTTPKDLDFF